MTYLADTVHTQLCGLWLSCMGWALTAVALGLVQWRVWVVSDREFISSGVAWVGLWRVCFNSHILVTPGFRVMYCQFMSLTETFTPPEIVAGQILMVLSLLVGLCANAGGVYALRNAYFGVEKNPSIRLLFYAVGALLMLAAAMSVVPLLWNLSSVATNQTIRFPPEFKMPPAPDSQHVGNGVWVGLVGTVMMVVSGLLFCKYRLPVRPRGRDNPGFEPQEDL
ncbi:claudin-34-like [Echeneis naucrates]|uniref:claudin-34-like n=1 Tax=Echeneis naucrates TaxID=173247 RepID=UPI0011133BB6|nr:claudin-34-like [Echeneis naucrates]